MEMPPDPRGLPLPLPPGIVKYEQGEMDSHEYETKPQISDYQLQPEVEINHQNQNDDTNSKSMNENIGGENMGSEDMDREDMGEFEDVINAKPSQSTVWKNFLLNKATGATKCKHCSKIMTRNTTSMRRHLKSLHQIGKRNVPEENRTDSQWARNF